MEAKHTPGPWMVWDVDQSIGTVTTADGEVNIAQAMMVKPAGTREGNEERKANTRLIATAPELLADLKVAAVQLRKYEALHRAKNTEDSLRKAEVNAELATRFEQTIAKATS